MPAPAPAERPGEEGEDGAVDARFEDVDVAIVDNIAEDNVEAGLKDVDVKFDVTAVCSEPEDTEADPVDSVT